MKFLMTIVEQLDRAATELKTDHPINNRLALILVDNATELMLHRQCMDRLEWDGSVSRLLKAHQSLAEQMGPQDQFEFSKDLRKDVLTHKQRSKAKGKFLDDKLKVLVDMGDLASAERRFIAIAHEYRNQLYHVGLSHDDITRAIAGHYFLLSCDLFVRTGEIGVFGPSFSSGDRYTEVAARYLPVSDGRLDTWDVDKAELAGKLRCALPAGMPDLAKTLAASAREAISVIVQDLEILVRDNPVGFDEGEVIKFVQWNRALTDALDREGVDGLWVDPNYRMECARVGADLELTWQQKHTSLPRRRWMDRAARVERETDPLKAMDLYQSLREDMAYLAEAIQFSAQELDRVIQEEIDRRRGK